MPSRQPEYYSAERCHILELSNTPEDAEASIARARVAPEVTTRWHRLLGTTERYVILEGNGRVEVGDRAAQDVSAGDVVIIPPLCPQRITNTGQVDLIFLAICTPRFRPAVYEDIEGIPVRINYAIVTVSDMKRSVAFYRDLLGLTLRFESPGWSEFATEGATLALHPGRGTERVDPQELPAGCCRPGFSVRNLDEFHRRMIESGVRCVQEPKETFGARIAQYLDPDGLAISVGEERRGT